MNRGTGSDRAATPVVGNILLVAVAIVIAVVLITMSFAFLEQTGAPTAEAKFDYQPTAAGLKMTPQALGTDVTVELNGNPVAEIDADSAGQSVLVPTAPGDQITVVSSDADRSVLVNRRIDERSEVGDLIAYYPFDSQNDSTLFDRSGNDNDGELKGDPSRQGSSLQFDRSNEDYVSVDDVTVENISDVDEFTIAVSYRMDDQGGNVPKQELVEHKSDDDNWLLELKPCDHSEVGNFCTGSDNYTPVFSVDQAGGTQDGQIFGGPESPGTEQVLVGTFDGSEHVLYVDGTQVNQSTYYNGSISMGDLHIGRDIEFDGDYFDGKISEVRLYYTAFEGDEVKQVTSAMSG